MYYFLFYTTEVAIGTPPQPFIAGVDLSWSDLFVPSSNCTIDPGNHVTCFPRNKYNSTQSLTYTANGKPTRTTYFALDASGPLSQDVLHLGPLRVDNQTFEEAAHWGAPDWYPVDCVLGLARCRYNGSEISTITAKSPLHNIIDQNSLEQNVFALKLPRTDGEGGELVLGGFDEQYSSSLLTIPVTNVTGGDNIAFVVASGWQVAVTAISLSATKSNGQPLDIPLPGYTALVSNYFDLISIPWSIVKQILEHMGFDFVDYLIDLPCDRRKDLPDLTVSFGDYGTLNLTPEQYLLEVDTLKGTRCVVPFNGDYLGGIDSPNPHFIVLGSVFLSSFYSVFNIDNRTISCKSQAPKFLNSY